MLKYNTSLLMTNIRKKEWPKFRLNKCEVDDILHENLQKHSDDECRLQNVECGNKCGVVLYSNKI